MIVLRTCAVPSPAERRAAWRIRYESLPIEQQLGIEPTRTCETAFPGTQAEAIDNADAESFADLRAGKVAVPRLYAGAGFPAQPAPINPRRPDEH